MSEETKNLTPAGENVCKGPIRRCVVEGAGTGAAELMFDDALQQYAGWPSPTVIISDGPYGLGKFPGEPKSTDDLAEWYDDHVRAWSRHSTPETTLWFWCSELGWAEVHPVLKAQGWRYRAAHIWNKGVGHVAGNCNSNTIRSFPVVTEICVQYVRDAQLPSGDGELLSLKAWLRSEWQRSGLPLNRANIACGVKDAATRKYFTQCDLWYFPPAEKMMRLAAYAAEHGAQTERPYFSLDGVNPLTHEDWGRMRAKWRHVHGLTNVWETSAVRGEERMRANNGLKALHANQKPLELVERTIQASSDEGDVVWEPFAGLASGLIGAARLGRRGYGAEIYPDYFNAAQNRLRSAFRTVGDRDDCVPASGT